MNQTTNHDPIPWCEHEEFINFTYEEPFHVYGLNVVDGFEIREYGTPTVPERFFLAAKVLVNGVRRFYVTGGTFSFLKDARAHVAEFAKMLAAMLVILSPMLLSGGFL